MNLSNVSVGIAFLAGMASFLSPCVFALVPAYVGYLGGRVAGAGKQANPWITFSHGIFFALGFSLVFIVLGFIASAIGGLVATTSTNLEIWLTRIGGIIVIIFGLHMIGVFRISFLEYDTRKQSSPDTRLGYLASLLMGIIFAAGWSPCVGPILGSILTMAFTGGSITEGIVLLSAYSAGLAIPFLYVSVNLGLVTLVISRFGKLMRYVEIATGVLLIFLGVFLIFGWFGKLNAQFSAIGSFFEVTDEVAIGRIIFIVILSLLILGLIPAYIAHKKGRSFRDWWFFGFSLLPIALPMALVINPKEEQPLEENKTQNQESDNPDH